MHYRALKPRKTALPLLVASIAFTPIASAQSRGDVISTQLLSPSQKHSRGAMLTGNVVDASGAVIMGAEVSIRDKAHAVQQHTQSDRSGFFMISGVRAGQYQIVVSRPGFETKEASVEVSNGREPYQMLFSLSVGAVYSSVEVEGREDDLTGTASSATQGTVGAREIQKRPILRSGEILETIPGVIITQHAGGGKANQYFLRGFNLDHGTDFAIFVDSMPLNLPSHAHGEGYADMNTVIPEFVQRVNYEKGPYYADVGNYGSAGSAHLEFFRSLPQDFVQVEGGMYGYGRLVAGLSRKLVAGNLLVGGEAYHDDGPWAHPDNYYKFNGLASYSYGEATEGFNATARAYHGSWHSSDQIAVNAVPLVGFFGTLNPTDGGRSQRYGLQGEWHKRDDETLTAISAYGFYYDLNLFSDFTYYLTDLKRGDQFEQKDRRWVTGIEARHASSGKFFGLQMENAVGLQVRNDWIHNGLFQSANRVRVDKFDSDTRTVLPATTQADRFLDTQVGFYAESKTQWASKFRSVTAIRGDVDRFDVTSLVTAANSGVASKVLPSPKLSLVLGPWASTEFYAQGGFSFHSNDGRGTTLAVQPVSADNPYPNTPGSSIPALIPTKGGEFGVRTSAIPHLQSTFSVWYLHSASELQQDGDTGGTTASRQPSNRYGYELANYYTPTKHLAVDVDLAQSRALFSAVDEDDAAPNSAGGKRVPEAVGLVLASGATIYGFHGISGSLRLRYFGPRDLTSDGAFRSQATALLNGEMGYRFGERWRISAEVLNLLDRRDHDIDYAYQSRITPSASAMFTNVFHPVEPVQVRFWLSRTF